jgi:hypothetical protein
VNITPITRQTIPIKPNGARLIAKRAQTSSFTEIRSTKKLFTAETQRHPKTQTPLMVKAINTRVRKTEFRQFSLNRQVHTFERQSGVAHISRTRVAYRVATER